MKTIALVLFISISFSSLMAQDTPDYHPNRIIIIFEENADLLQQSWGAYTEFSKIKRQSTLFSKFSKLDTFLEFHKINRMEPLTVKIDGHNPENPISRIFLMEAEGDILQIIEDLQKNPEIQTAQPDYIGHGSGQKLEMWWQNDNNQQIPNDAQFGNQWALRNTGQSIFNVQGVAGADINVVPAWDLTTGNEDIIIAILDSGISEIHNDFSGRIVEGKSFGTNTTSTADDHGHGTNVAAIAAATGNNSGSMAGVDWNSRIMPVKILNSNNSGFYSWWISALDYVVEQNVHVANMSVGGSGVSSGLEMAVNRALNAGVVVVACMMNTNNNVTYYPAAYDGVISVGATNNRDNRAAPFCWSSTSGSNFGNHIDLVAPGEGIMGLSNTLPNSVNFWCGTSQASPLVAGTIGLMLAVRPDLERDEIHEALINTARRKIGEENTERKFDMNYGWGRLDVEASIKYVMNNGTSIDSDPENPLTVQLQQNYPNPFNPSTQINFYLPENAAVSLQVFDSLGRHVATLINEMLPFGTHQASFDGSQLFSGLYLYKLDSGNFTTTKKMLLVK